MTDRFVVLIVNLIINVEGLLEIKRQVLKIEY